MSFYMTYLARWPDYFHVAVAPGHRVMGYSQRPLSSPPLLPSHLISSHSFLLLSLAVMGKVEGQGESWHGHVTALTVAPEYRRQKLAKKLMTLLEDFSDHM